MNIAQRLLFADAERMSRFHDGNGKVHIHSDMFRSLYSTFVRHAFNRFPKLPWVTYRAIEELKMIAPGRSVFEYGAGTSTEWLSRQADQVVSVENDSHWAQLAREAVKGRSNVEIKTVENEDDFINSIPPDARFDIYIVDCKPVEGYASSTEDLRIHCLRLVHKHAAPDAFVIVDNTDVNKVLSSTIRELYAGRTVKSFSGWVPGSFHPNETTIVYPARY